MHIISIVRMNSCCHSPPCIYILCRCHCLCQVFHGWQAANGWPGGAAAAEVRTMMFVCTHCSMQFICVSTNQCLHCFSLSQCMLLTVVQLCAYTNTIPGRCRPLQIRHAWASRSRRGCLFTAPPHNTHIQLALLYTSTNKLPFTNNVTIYLQCTQPNYSSNMLLM